MKKNCILILIFTLFIKSCASTYPITQIEDKSLEFDENDSSGLIVGTITFLNERARFNQYQVEVVSMSTNADIMERNSTRILIFPNQIIKMRHNGVLDEGLTYLLVFKRPIGSYEIYNINVSATAGYTSSTSSINGFTIPFESKKGSVTYFGNLIINEYADENAFEVGYNDNFDRDVKEMRNLYPNLKFDLDKVNRNTNFSHY